MSEREMAELMNEALSDWSDENGGEIRRVSSFEDEGVMTTNAGLVLYTEDGSEFQVTIVRSR